MIAACDAPCDLQIDNSVADAITSNHLAHDDAKRALGQPHPNAQFAKRSLKPSKMSPLVDEAATPHLAYFIYAIAELIAAILDVNFGVWKRQITAIDVSDAGHARSDVEDQRWKVKYQKHI
jgi:hypothetical protein